MKKIKIAVLGMNHGYKFACDALKIPDVELVAVAGDNDSAISRAKELNVPIFHDYKDLIHACVLDGVIITLPNRLHKEAVELCASRGLHVLVEKPIASTIEEGEAIIQSCKRNNVKLLVGHHRRFSSKMVKLREIISSGALGNLIGVNMLWVLAKDPSYFSEGWKISEGGGPLLINSIHDIDNLRFATGLTIKSVYAVANNRIRNNPVEDTASVILETAEGVTINYFLSDGTPAPWSYELTVRENPKYHFSNDNCYYFFGTKGSLAFPKFHLYSHKDGAYGWDYPLEIEQINVENNDPMTAELLHFINVLRGEEDSLITGEDALETLKVMHAVLRSAKTEQKIYVQ